MYKVKHILDKKGSSVATIDADATLLDVQSRCAEGSIDSETFIIIVQADRDGGISKQEELTVAINGCAFEVLRFECIDCLTAVIVLSTIKSEQSPIAPRSKVPNHKNTSIPHAVAISCEA